MELYIIATLNDGSRRFNELKREIEGISQRMRRCHCGLERDGLVTRTVFPTIPPRVDCAHAARRNAAGPSWRSSGGRRKQEPIAQARERFDEAADAAPKPGEGVVYRSR